MRRNLLMLVVLLLLVISACESKEESNEIVDQITSDRVVSDSGSSDSSDVGEKVHSLTGISLDEADLKFSQTYPIWLNGNNMQIVNIHTELDGCELEICKLSNRDAITGDVVLFGTDTNSPLLVATVVEIGSQMYNEINQENVIWTLMSHSHLD